MKKLLGFILAAAAVMSFVSLSSIDASAYYIKGDLNGDNKISLRDASIAQKIDVGLITPSSDQLRGGDVDGNGAINAQDSLMIQKYVCLDKETMEAITPNKQERINFVSKINEDRVNRGLLPFSCTDAHYEAGNIRANEYLTNQKDTRPDGSDFFTVLTECNLNYNASITPNQIFVHEYMDADSVYNHLVKYYSDDDKMYALLMSGDYTTLCVGSIKESGNTDHYLWAIIIK